ncbi:MFS transporter [Corynebacterium ulceribovis]|uniref:MFS transporter n=1 Tax=Corynebacterium ulceribovis TaxID=487732 RepID=UPI000476BF89|nr:MFS transporter [Corynebacterium ulceribovis]
MTNNDATPTTPQPATPGPHPRDQVTSRAVTVWAVAVFFYLIAIVGRTSLGVAGVEAMDRFAIDASRLAVFTSVQLGVYALAQIPVGLAVDRFGPRKTMIVGAIIMAVGQVTLALTASYPIAIVARVLIGAGDATAFLSVMRMIPAWFPLKLTPVFAQLTAGIGTVGQLVSALPFLILLHASNWTTAFLSIGAIGVLTALLGWLALQDTPEEPRRRKAQSATTTMPKPTALPLGTSLQLAVAHPATWTGFFAHFIGLQHMCIFVLLWGMPLMTLGQGLTPNQASSVLVLNAIGMIVFSPVVGMLSARFGLNRWMLVITATLLLAGSFIGFFLQASPRSFTAVAVLSVILAMFTPFANVGFDTVREHIDRQVLATGTGVANMGGFVSSMVASQAFGVLLDHSAHGAGYAWADFRFAWIGVASVWAFGVVGYVVSRLRLHRYLRRQQPTELA